MAFNDLNVAELREFVSASDIEVVSAGDKPNKKEIIATLVEKDIPFSEYEKWIAEVEGTNNDEDVKSNKPEKDEVKDEPAPVKEEELVAIKYERKNPTFEIVGYSFNTRHPYAYVPEGVADYLVRNVEGFRLALKSEVLDYYK